MTTAVEQGVKITPILQSAEEFNWGNEQWDLVDLLYVGAVRGNVAKIRNSLKPGGLVVDFISIGDELKTNPFMRCDSPEIRKYLKLEEATDAEVFAELRTRKNKF